MKAFLALVDPGSLILGLASSATSQSEAITDNSYFFYIEKGAGPPVWQLKSLSFLIGPPRMPPPIGFRSERDAAGLLR